MGGAMAIVPSVIGLISNVASRQSGSQGNSQADRLKAEREAREEEQRQQEAEDRKRERDKVLEAREVEQKRLVAKKKDETTLLNGGAGLLVEPEKETSGLKDKFGE